MNAVVTTKDHSAEFKQTLTRMTLRNDSLFFIALIYSLRHERHDPMIIRGQRAPAATDGVSLCYDSELFAKYSIDDRQFIMVHEVLHVVLMHAMRRGAREPNLWNIACDYVVNGMMVETTAFKMPADGIQPDPAFKGLSAEQVYDLLQKEAEQALAGGKKQGQGKNGRVWVRGEPQPGSGKGSAQLDGKHPNDVKDYDPQANGGKSASEAERDIALDTEKALHAAKAAGQGSKLISELLHEAQVVKEPWHSHLRRFMTVLNAREYNWAHINRRRAAFLNVITPELRSESMGDLVVSIDESGSLMNEQLAAISAHVSQCCREVNPKRLVVIRHTDTVTHVEEFSAPYNFVLERKSTGGTDFRPVFDYIAANVPEAQVILMFTDMYGPMPQGFPIDTIWVTSTPEKTCPTPFGERIQADFND